MTTNSKIQPFTDEQEKRIGEVMGLHYERVITATSILKLLKVYHRQSEECKVFMDDAEVEYILKEVDALLQPVENILAELSGGGVWYLLDERALEQ